MGLKTKRRRRREEGKKARRTGVNVVCSLVGVDDLEAAQEGWCQLRGTEWRRKNDELGRNPRHRVLVTRRVSAKDVEQDSRVLQRLAAVVALENRDHLGRPVLVVLEAAELDGGDQAEDGFCRSVGELLLHELEATGRVRLV